MHTTVLQVYICEKVCIICFKNPGNFLLTRRRLIWYIKKDVVLRLRRRISVDLRLQAGEIPASLLRVLRKTYNKAGPTKSVRTAVSILNLLIDAF